MHRSRAATTVVDIAGAPRKSKQYQDADQYCFLEAQDQNETSIRHRAALSEPNPIRLSLDFVDDQVRADLVSPYLNI
jgi:hypothetical protein